MISQKLIECILKHTVIKFLCYGSTEDILHKMFALSNVTHRNTITATITRSQMQRYVLL